MIARIFLRKGEYDRAIEYYKKSLEIQKKIYEKEPNHLKVAFAENSIAHAYLEKHKSISNKSNNDLHEGTYYLEKALEKISKFEARMRAPNLRISLYVILAKQGCRNVSNIGGAPIHLDQSFIESMQLLVPKITDVGTFPLYLWH